MYDNELDKTFVERSPASFIPAAYANDGNSIPLPNSRPIIGQTCLGSSLITDIIGEGGMATVYKAWNERLEVFRAVKLLSQEAYSARFETEAKIVAKLRHEGIVEVYNVGEWNGLSYMEMEFVDGSDLQQTLAKRKIFPENVCVAIATLVAEALTHAHTKTFTLVGKQYCGIIHRDLKPANIMISKHGEVKLTDFGIARPTEASLHTIEGNIAGTLHYLSPEQMDGRDVDNRSDIYSFGTILYEMITGAKTFPQESITELMKQKSANKFKPLNEYGIQINADLAKIILRCLKFTPAKRYQRTQDLVNDLQKLNNSLTKQMPKDVLKSYLDGIETVTYKESGKTRTRWLFGKLKTLGTTDKPKILEPEDELNLTEEAVDADVDVDADTPKVVEIPETPKEPEPIAKVEPAEETVNTDVDTNADVNTDADTPKAVELPEAPKEPEPIAKIEPAEETVDVNTDADANTDVNVDTPKAAEVPETPKEPEPIAKAVDTPKISKAVVEQKSLGKTDKPKVSKPPKKIKNTKTAEKPKKTEPVAKVKPLRISDKPTIAGKPTISIKSKRIALAAPLLLLAVLSLPYIAIKSIPAKKSATTKSLMAKNTISTDMIPDSAALTVTESISNDTAILTQKTEAILFEEDTVLLATPPLLEAVQPSEFIATASTQVTAVDTAAATKAPTPAIAATPATRTVPPPTATAATPSTQTAAPPATRAVAATPASTPTSTTAPPTRTAATAPTPESEMKYVIAATAAINARQWSQAIEILEQDGVYGAWNDRRTLHLFNAYVEMRRFDKAKAIMDTISLKQDAYFLFCVGKFWRYWGAPDVAVRFFEQALTRTSIVGTQDILPETALYLIATIRHEQFNATPTASNKSSALEAWRRVQTALASKPDDPRARKAEHEISALSEGRNR